MKKRYEGYLNKDNNFDKTTKIHIIILIAIISGFFGFFYEYIFYFFNGGMRDFYWRGGNFLPWLDIYAIGAVVIYFLCYKDRKKPLKVFLKSGLSCGIIELIAGSLIYLLRNGYRSWNYNTEILNFGNIGGFVCLRSVLVFATCGLLLIYIIVPLCFLLAKKLPKKVFGIIITIIFLIILVDEIYNLIIIRLISLPPSWDIYTSLGIKYVKS